MSDLHCWRCNRRLPVTVAPKDEDAVITCHRCKAQNVVRRDVPAKPLDKLTAQASH